MRAVRFGSYSIADDRRLDVALAALEVDDAVLLLVAATDVTGGDAAVVVAAAASSSSVRPGSSPASTW